MQGRADTGALGMGAVELVGRHLSAPLPKQSDDLTWPELHPAQSTSLTLDLAQETPQHKTSGRVSAKPVRISIWCLRNPPPPCAQSASSTRQCSAQLEMRGLGGMGWCMDWWKDRRKRWARGRGPVVGARGAAGLGHGDPRPRPGSKAPKGSEPSQVSPLGLGEGPDMAWTRYPSGVAIWFPVAQTP